MTQLHATIQESTHVNKFYTNQHNFTNIHKLDNTFLQHFATLYSSLHTKTLPYLQSFCTISRTCTKSRSFNNLFTKTSQNSNKLYEMLRNCLNCSRNVYETLRNFTKLYKTFFTEIVQHITTLYNTLHTMRHTTLQTCSQNCTIFTTNAYTTLNNTRSSTQLVHN